MPESSDVAFPLHTCGNGPDVGCIQRLAAAFFRERSSYVGRAFAPVFIVGLMSLAYDEFAHSLRASLRCLGARVPLAHRVFLRSVVHGAEHGFALRTAFRWAWSLAV